MNPKAISTIGARCPRALERRVIFCVGAYGLDSFILVGSKLSTNAKIHGAAAETASIVKTRDRRLPCNFLFVMRRIK